MDMALLEQRKYEDKDFPLRAGEMILLPGLISKVQVNQDLLTSSLPRSLLECSEQRE